MMPRAFLATLAILAGAASAGAQTKISGTFQCAKPDQRAMLEVGDRTGHSLAVAQNKCSATKAWEISGVASKEGVSTAADEIRGNTSRTRGYYVDSMTNGDKTFFHYEGSVSLKDGAPQSAEVQWTLTGGTGKLKGVKGKGSCKGSGSSDGGMMWECEGEYEAAK